MQTPPQNEANPPTIFQRFMHGFNQTIPVIGLIYAIVLTIGGYWLYARDAQTVQAQSIEKLQTGQKTLEQTMNERSGKRDRQFDEMEKKMLTRELYEAYRRADVERMERIEKMLERLLDK